MICPNCKKETLNQSGTWKSGGLLFYTEGCLKCGYSVIKQNSGKIISRHFKNNISCKDCSNLSDWVIYNIVLFKQCKITSEKTYINENKEFDFTILEDKCPLKNKKENLMINWDKPKKIRTTEENNNMFSSDCSVPGTYSSNMSEKDKASWKGKIINKDKENSKIELRKEIWNNCHVNVLIIVSLNEKFKNDQWKTIEHSNITISMNGKLHLTFEEFEEIKEVIDESVLKLKGNSNETFNQ